MKEDACTLIRYVYSCILLAFSIVIVFGLMASGQTTLARDVHPAFAVIMLIVSITWLTMVEGGQGSLVGLAPVDRRLYKDTHKWSYMCTSLCHKGDNLDRYLLGRQFMVVLVVFCVNMSGGPVGGATLWGFPEVIINIFLVSGLAMILLTCMVGQLNSQVNGCHCMLDYINNWFAVFTLWVAMGIEFSGLLHSSYLIQFAVGKLAGKPIESLEPPRTTCAELFFSLRCIMSLAILGFAFAVTLTALFEGKTTIWEFFPPGVSVVIFFILLCVVGLLEGMQIAFFAVAKLQKSERGDAKFAKMTCEVLFRNRGRNLSGFMIGRQLCVVSCMFFVARITSVNGSIFNAPQGLQNLFDTGLLGALIVTIVGSISWQLVASAFPIAFLSNPLVYILLRICLLLEATGLCSGAWVLAKLHKRIAGFRRDEVYIGTAEERAEKALADKEKQLRYGAGHPIKIPIPYFSEINTQTHNIEELEALEADLLKHQEEVETRLEKLARQKRMIQGSAYEYICTSCGGNNFYINEEGKYMCSDCGANSFRIKEVGAKTAEDAEVEPLNPAPSMDVGDLEVQASESSMKKSVV